MEVCPVNADCPGFVCTTDITFPRFENYRLRRESKGVKYFLVTCAKKMREKKKKQDTGDSFCRRFYPKQQYRAMLAIISNSTHSLKDLKHYAFDFKYFHHW